MDHAQRAQSVRPTTPQEEPVSMIPPKPFWKSHSTRNYPLIGRTVNELTMPYQWIHRPILEGYNDPTGLPCSTIGCCDDDFLETYQHTSHHLDEVSLADDGLDNVSMEAVGSKIQTNILEQKLSESTNTEPVQHRTGRVDLPPVRQLRQRKASILLSLPTEIRRQIFSYLLVPLGSGSTFELGDDVCRVLRWKVEWDAEARENITDEEYFDIQHWEITMPLLICWQIFLEMMPIFYQEHTFVFPTVKMLGYFLYNIGSRRRKFIRNVVVNEEESTPRIAIKAYRLLGESCHLQNLELILDCCDYLMGERELRSRTRAQRPAAEIWAWVPELCKCSDLMVWRERVLQNEVDGIHILQKFRGLRKFTITDRSLLDNLDKNGEFCPMKDYLLDYERSFEKSLAEAMTTPKSVMSGATMDSTPALCEDGIERETIPQDVNMSPNDPPSPERAAELAPHGNSRYDQAEIEEIDTDESMRY